jgi:hypothetical protein
MSPARQGALRDIRRKFAELFRPPRFARRAAFIYVHNTITAAILQSPASILSAPGNATKEAGKKIYLLTYTKYCFQAKTLAGIQTAKPRKAHF